MCFARTAALLGGNEKQKVNASRALWQLFQHSVEKRRPRARNVATYGQLGAPKSRQERPKTRKNVQEAPKAGQEAPKTRPRRASERPRGTQERPRKAQKCPRGPQTPSKRSFASPTMQFKHDFRGEACSKGSWNGFSAFFGLRAMLAIEQKPRKNCGFCTSGVFAR